MISIDSSLLLYQTEDGQTKIEARTQPRDFDVEITPRTFVTDH